MDYFVQEGHLFKGHWLCIPKGSFIENLIRELDNGGLVRHFCVDKTQDLVEEKYYWHGLPLDVEKWV